MITQYWIALIIFWNNKGSLRESPIYLERTKVKLIGVLRGFPNYKPVLTRRLLMYFCWLRCNLSYVRRTSMLRKNESLLILWERIFHWADELMCQYKLNHFQSQQYHQHRLELWMSLLPITGKIWKCLIWSCWIPNQLSKHSI